MRRFRRLRLAAAGWLRILVVLTAVGYLVIRLADWVVLEPLVAVAETEARVKGIDAINRIVLGSLSQMKHEELIIYEKDQQGRIAAYHIDTGLVNRVASEAATAVRDEFGKMSNETFGVPMGALSGSRMLASRGPVIPIPMMPIGSVIIDIQQSFKAEGINQTRHSIWLHATARVRLVLPFVSREVEVATDLPITDTVVVGSVPSSFYGGNLGAVTLPAGPPTR